MAHLCRSLGSQKAISSPSKALPWFQSMFGVYFYSTYKRFPVVESLTQNSDSSKPWLMRPFRQGHTKFYDVVSSQTSGFSATKIPERCVSSTKGWLVCTDIERKSKGDQQTSMYLYSPFQLPHKRKPIKLPSLINIPYVDNGFGSLSGKFVTPNMMRNFALSSSDPYDPYCTLMASVQDGPLRRLACCRPGIKKEKEWTVLHDSYPICDQLVYSEKLSTFYAISCDGSIEAWDFSGPGEPKKKDYCANFPSNSFHAFPGDEITLRGRCLCRSYIVVDDLSGDLLCVVKYYGRHVTPDGAIVDEDPQNVFPYRTQRIDVYKFDFKAKVLERLNNLCGSLFLGYDESFILPFKDFPGLRPNSIYFVDDFPEKIYAFNLPFGGHDSGIYNMEDNSITPFPALADSRKIQQQMFWIAPTTPSG